MLSTADFKKGLRILVDGEPYTVEDYSVQTPSARGAATLVKARLRGIVTGTVMDRTFKAGEKFDEPDVVVRQIQFLYRDGDEFHFMDQQSFEQFSLSADVLGEAGPWLTEGLQLPAVLFNGRPVGVTLPAFLEAEVDIQPIPSEAGNDVTVVLDIVEKNEIYIEEVRIRGNIKTQDRVIRRELEFYPGERVDRSKVVESRSNLHRLQFFNSVNFTYEREGSSLGNRHVVVDVEDTLRGYARLKALAASPRHVVPGHDPLVLQRYPALNSQTRGIVHRLDVPRLDT